MTVWETFDHVADIGVRGEGDTPAEAFAEGARALFSIVTDLDAIEPREEVEFACEAPDVELLFVRWLNALLAEADLRGLVFCDFHVTVDGSRLVGRARGERFAIARHAPGVEVKGATLTGLSVELRGGRWFAETVVDV